MVTDKNAFSERTGVWHGFRSEECSGKWFMFSVGLRAYLLFIVLLSICFSVVKVHGVNKNVPNTVNNMGVFLHAGILCQQPKLLAVLCAMPKPQGLCPELTQLEQDNVGLAESERDFMCLKCNMPVGICNAKRHLLKDGIKPEVLEGWVLMYDANRLKNHGGTGLMLATRLGEGTYGGGATPASTPLSTDVDTQVLDQPAVGSETKHDRPDSQHQSSLQSSLQEHGLPAAQAQLDPPTQMEVMHIHVHIGCTQPEGAFKAGFIKPIVGCTGYYHVPYMCDQTTQASMNIGPRDVITVHSPKKRRWGLW